jgi:hypothetical protein
VALEERTLVARQLVAGLDAKAGGDQLIGAADRDVGGERFVDLGGEPRSARLGIGDAERREVDAEGGEPGARQQRVPRERIPRDGLGVAGDRRGLVRESLVDPREPVRALAALEGTAASREGVEAEPGLVPLAEEVVRHAEEPQRVVGPLRARIAPE